MKFVQANGCFLKRPMPKIRFAWALAAALLILVPGMAPGQERTNDAGHVAPVRIDGKVLFEVRGVSAFPADERARRISERIRAFAQDDTRSLDSLVAEPDGDHLLIRAGDLPLLRLYEIDAQLEEVPLATLSEAVVLGMREAISKYRADRTPSALSRSAGITAILTLVVAGLFWGVIRARHWLNGYLKRRMQRRLAEIERKSGAAVRRGHLLTLTQALLQAVWIVLLLTIAYFYLSSVLGAFPWTRGAALLLIEYVKTPLAAMGSGLVDSIPDLIFLVVLWAVVRYLLATLKSFLQAVGAERLKLANFEPEWADPTYRLLRVAIIAFALVVAYPYIPGSESAAFKGVSLFLGIIVSLGSTSFIANLIAGIALTYRGVFREGDWVKIDTAEGYVESIRSQVVRLRTRDNECISVPSSTILNANVVNLSTPADGPGIVLRCPVGLGYDVSWRTAERVLLAAAEGQDGLLADPAPRVLVTELGDYAVVHTLLVRVAEPAELPAVRSALMRAVLDGFHGEGIQIMSPAYVGDPAQEKIPAKDDAPSTSGNQ